MSVLCHISLPQDGYAHVPLSELNDTHGLNRRASQTYDRFYGLQAVIRHEGSLDRMLSDVLGRALEQVPDASERAGQLVYCKTQTHNTRTDLSWLRRFADAHDLGHWEVSSLSMTSCTSALVQMHVAELCETDGPLIVLTGEKAFHPWVSRLPVGLLAEVPSAAVFNAGQGSWRVAGTSVRHLPRFHQNPDTMSADDRRALQTVYADALIAFMEESLARYGTAVTRNMAFLPHNLNRPMTDVIIRHFGWEALSFHGDMARTGHAYCSDGFMNLAAFEAAGRPERQVLILAAGTGVTFATCLLDRIPTPKL
ncbi:3-oxoacyl-[acyl-carrier-protein] synthase III C-terminal domain-containing protein [Thalassococcus sp. S3]|uniref:3-oxoacyl-[acyl-carrier-protein] synthase III C-terminal domain-containing protein n=1 Tax=Thalassococcus sp. S3 TaxID=2017482 RepID=UPI001023FA2F|nr:3-oxoacyl-[acyl-carrier-protein] synthase III C-terminal domain-containing protein [Thalassococcus sp. S3]QBF29658.1 hypothetical protein CFI11_00310 [Thalassococcus sp. S3]